jgi:dUTP pyrophosphatase
MQMIPSWFKILKDGAQVPAYKHKGDAALDVFTYRDEYVPPHKIMLIKIGVAVEFLGSFCAHIFGRSGLTLQGFIVHHGLIDPNYRGEIGVICQNITDEPMTFPKGSRIAQMYVAETTDVHFHEVPALTETERGTDGFGSSGV